MLTSAMQVVFLLEHLTKEENNNMKILIINGSAHKGNTWKLVEQAKCDLMKFIC